MASLGGSGLGVSREVAVRMLAGAAVIWRLDWGWQVYIQEGTLPWLLAGDLSFSPCGPLPGLHGHPYNMAAGSLGASQVEAAVSFVAKAQKLLLFPQYPISYPAQVPSSMWEHLHVCMDARAGALGGHGGGWLLHHPFSLLPSIRWKSVLHCCNAYFFDRLIILFLLTYFLCTIRVFYSELALPLESE